MRNVLLVTLELDKVPLITRNKIISEVKKTNKRYILENQNLKIDINTLNVIAPILNEVK